MEPQYVDTYTVKELETRLKRSARNKQLSKRTQNF